MRPLIQSLLATAIIALPAEGTAVRPDRAVAAGVVTTVNPTPAAADPCAEAVVQAAVVYAWHISNFLFCPTGLCIPLIEASAYAFLVSAAYAATVCAI